MEIDLKKSVLYISRWSHYQKVFVTKQNSEKEVLKEDTMKPEMMISGT